jgi:ribonuclease HI
VKLAAQNMIQLVWVPLHMGIDVNETADHILISIFMTSDCLWHIYKGCHRNDQELEEPETPGI